MPKKRASALSVPQDKETLDEILFYACPTKFNEHSVLFLKMYKQLKCTFKGIKKKDVKLRVPSW